MTTETLAQQVAELKVGEYVTSTWKGEHNYVVEGWLWGSDIPTALLMLGPLVIRTYGGNLHPDLTSIRKVERPIPNEPEVGSFGLCDGGDVTQMIYESPDLKHWRMGNGKWYSWPEIYPHITRLYTPKGEPVEGFEYYESKEG